MLFGFQKGKTISINHAQSLIMAIGIMLTFFDFRNDVRKVITEMATKAEIVLFIRPEHVSLITPYLQLGFTYRIIQEYKPGFRNKLAHLLFLLFRRLPKSRENYFLMEEFKSQSLPPHLKKKAKRALLLQRILPKWMSYDFYLNMLNYSKETQIDDITHMLVWTEIYDDYLFARCAREGIPTHVYVYSWDHSCKHVRFSKRVHYLVWHAGIAEDVQQLQNVARNHVQIVGSTQLGYIKAYQSESPAPIKKELYYYFGCGVGIAQLIPEEIRIILIIAEIIRQTQPTHKLVVRPYPNCRDWAVYAPLRQHTHIQIEDDYRQTDLSIRDQDIVEKFVRISKAKAFFHTGTTLGLEACFTDTPSFIIDMAEKSNEAVCLYHFIHQYQNEKYLMHSAPENVIQRIDQLIRILEQPDDSAYMQLSYQVRDMFPVADFSEMANRLIQATG